MFDMSREESCFVKEDYESKNKYTEDDIINILEFLVDNVRLRSLTIVSKN